MQFRDYNPNSPMDVREFAQEIKRLTSSGPIGAAQAERKIEELMKIDTGRILVKRARLTGKIATEAYGISFTNAKIYTDDNPGQVAIELGTHAFATGQDLYAGSGESGGLGSNLVTHELTHVIQQGGMK